MARNFNTTFSRYTKNSTSYGSVLFNTGQTISIRFRRTTSQTQGLMSAGSSNWYLRLDSSGHVSLLQSQIAVIATGSTAFTDTNWHTLVFSKTSGNVNKCWVDNTLEFNVTDSTNLTAGGPSALTIGCDNFGSGTSFAEFFEGDLAEAAIWNVVLSAEEVSALTFNPAFMVCPTALKFYVPMTGIDASTDPDYMANANPMTLVNSPAAANHPPIVPLQVLKPQAVFPAAAPTITLSPYYYRLLGGIAA